MKKQTIGIFLFLSFFLYSNASFCQNENLLNNSKSVSKLFEEQKNFPIKISYSNKNIKKETNDSTYSETFISYKIEGKEWEKLEIGLRVRGNNRLKNCYFPPLKLKIRKSESNGTLFEGNKKLKLVLPCSSNKGMNDYVVKEYMAYKLFEIVTPYHFNTRMIDIYYTDEKDKKTKSYELKGFFIEDIKKVAKRHDGKVVKNSVHPFSQDPVSSVQNAFFQFMIGNTDYSIAYQHNEKLLFVNKKFVPIPYDFDMSGLVNAYYAVVSEVNGESLPISSVKERFYKGFKRNQLVIQQVRKEFLDNKLNFMQIVDGLEPYFEDSRKFTEAKNYIFKFFETLENDARFKKEITSHLRTKHK